MNKLNFDLMNILIATAETQNLYQAADRLHVSQALVSVKLKELETQVPLPVFGLEGRRKVLTRYGRDLYEAAKIQSQSWQDSIEQLNRRYVTAEKLTLKVGGRPEALDAYTSQVEFAGRLKLEVMSSKQAIDKLLAHEIDIAISYLLPNSTEVIAKKIFESTAQLLVHRQWLKEQYLDPTKNKDFLLNTPCLLYTDQGHLIREWLNYLKISLDQIQVKIISEDWRTLLRHIEEKKGYSVVPSYIKTDDKNIVSMSLPTSVLPKYTFYACFHKELRKVAAFRKLLNFNPNHSTLT